MRSTWKRGSQVEIYSKLRRKWCRGLITKIFKDSEGEWLKIGYEKTATKEVARFSHEIRPWKPRLKPYFTCSVCQKDKKPIKQNFFRFV